MNEAQYTLILYATVFEKERYDGRRPQDAPQHEAQISITATLDDLSLLLNNNATAQAIRQMATRAVQSARRAEFTECEKRSA